jgi:large subunit ribosomal protein L18
MKITIHSLKERRERRKRRVRAKISGTAERPRLSVSRSLQHISCQLIDDVAGRTLAAARDGELAAKAPAKEGMGAKVASAYAVGQLLAEKAKKAGITAVVFDRNGYAFTGRVAALAQGGRDGGLQF